MITVLYNLDYIYLATWSLKDRNIAIEDRLWTFPSHLVLSPSLSLGSSFTSQALPITSVCLSQVTFPQSNQAADQPCGQTIEMNSKFSKLTPLSPTYPIISCPCVLDRNSCCSPLTPTLTLESFISGLVSKANLWFLRHAHRSEKKIAGGGGVGGGKVAAAVRKPEDSCSDAVPCRLAPKFKIVDSPNNCFLLPFTFSKGLPLVPANSMSKSEVWKVM